MMRKVGAGLAGLLLSLLVGSGASLAQCQRVIENGTVQNNAPVIWIAPCVIGQAGPSTGSGGNPPMISDFGVQGNVGILDAPITGAYHSGLLGWSTTVPGEFDITLTGIPGAVSAAVIENGIKFPFPFSNPLPGFSLAAVPDNTTLLATSTVSVPAGVVRMDFTIGNGAPPLFYRPSASACSLNAGAGDNASQVKSLNSKCWLAAWTGTELDVREFGATTASADNAAVFTTADAAGAALGGAQMVVPAGSWNVLSVPTFSTKNQWILQPGATLAGTSALATQVTMFGYLSGQTTFNPYAYNTAAGASPLSQNILYSPNGSMTISNPVPHGILQSRSVLTMSTGGNVDNMNDVSECFLGIADVTATTIGSVWNDGGAGPLCGLANAAAPLTVRGTFTATTFVPTTPFLPNALLIGNLPPKDVWIVTQDDPPYIGLSTGTTLNGSGQITSITVGGWVQSGQTTFGTPATNTAELNFQPNLFAENVKALLVTLNGMTVSTTSGSANVTIAGVDLALVSKFQFIGDGGVDIPSNAVITSINPVTGAGTIDPPATGTETAVTATIAAEPFNLGQVGEYDDRNHSGFPLDPSVFAETANVTSGSNVATAVSDVADLRIGMNCAGTNFGLSVVLAINRAGNTITLNRNQPSTAAATFTCYWGYQTGVAGLVASSQNSTSGANFISRGVPFAGFLAMGATEDAFLAGRQTSSDGAYGWGFRVDETFRVPAQCEFGITVNEKAAVDGANTFWCVNKGLETFNTSGVTLPSAMSSNFMIRLSSAAGGPIFNAISYGGMGAYMVPAGAHGTPASPSALQAGDPIGGIQGGGFDGVAWNYSSGNIDLRAATLWTASSHADNIAFSTVPTLSTTPRVVMQIDQDGTLVSLRGTNPIVSSGGTACGTGPTVVGSPMTGVITVGTSTVGTSCQVTWQPGGFTTDQVPHCMISDRSTNALIRMTTTSQTGFIFTGAIAASDNLDYVCLYNN